MKGIFVNDDSYPFASEIVDGVKQIETRKRNMLKSCVGERVAIIRTSRSEKPVVIGYATISRAYHFTKVYLDLIREYTRVPEGSPYDWDESGKWCYLLTNPERCLPYPLPSSALRHGRSWCEFEGF